MQANDVGISALILYVGKLRHWAVEQIAPGHMRDLFRVMELFAQLLYKFTKNH